MHSEPNSVPPPETPETRTWPEPGPRLSTVKKLVFTVLVLIVFAGGAEALCRLLGLGRHEPVAHYISNWHNTPEGRTFWVVRGQGYNPDGMRDREHAVEKPLGVHRIVCLGDSVTAGHGVKRSESYPFLLEAFLNQVGRRAGFSAEVLNVAASGWSTAQQVAAYEIIARRYHPDEVFLGFCLNDVAEMYNNLSSPPPAAVSMLVRHSALIRWLIDAEGRQVHNVEELFHRPDSQAVQGGWRLVFAELEALRRATLNDGCDLSVIVFPFRFQLEGDAPPPIAQRNIVDFCRSRGIPCLDLLPALRKVGPTALRDASHLSPTGARAVAEEIIRWSSAPGP